jgi:L,D-transpeptidase ErfK/SrfK
MMVFNFSSLDKTLCQIIDLSPLSNRLHLLILLMFILSFHGCAGMRETLDKLRIPIIQEKEIERNDFFVAKEDNVIGRLAAIRLKKGDTLPDIARHFSLGINTVSAANPGIDIWVPEAGERILLPLSFILPDTHRKGIVINLAAMRLFYFNGNGNPPLAVSTYPVGIGTTERPTPMGQMYITRKKLRPTWYVPASIAEDYRKKGYPLPPKVPPGPLNPLGEHALYLSKPEYLVHGTNKPSSIGLRATNGCIRLFPEDIKRLFENTPVETPVNIVNQPYLVGQRDGIIYIEVHKPFEESDSTALKKAYAKLRNIEKKSGHKLDWEKVKAEVAEARGIPVPISEISHGDTIRAELAEARGIPVPISEISHGDTKGVTVTLELKHPGNLYGKPEIPELKTDAWYVLAATLRDKVDAQRLAAIINHQGPQIPARVLSKADRHRVIAGPFNNMSEAKEAAKRLKIDLEIDGILIDP